MKDLLEVWEGSLRGKRSRYGGGEMRSVFMVVGRVNWRFWNV